MNILINHIIITILKSGITKIFIVLLVAQSYVQCVQAKNFNYAPMANITYDPLLKVLEEEIIPYVQLNKRYNSDVAIIIEHDTIDNQKFWQSEYNFKDVKYEILIYIQWLCDKLDDYIKNKIENTNGDFYVVDIAGSNIYFTTSVSDNKIIKPISKKKYLGESYDKWWFTRWGDETYTSILFLCGDNLFRCVNITNAEFFYRPDMKTVDTLLPSIPIKIQPLSDKEDLLKSLDIKLNFEPIRSLSTLYSI